jgi:hypothetical protein
MLEMPVDPETVKAGGIIVSAAAAAKIVLGPTAQLIGEDIMKMYAAGRDKILEKAFRKISNLDDGKAANLRIAHDIFVNGVVTDDEICAEYFGGMLAASRSENGSNDEPIQFVSVTKSLSSHQLRLHYQLYSSLHSIARSHAKEINVGHDVELAKATVWLSALELGESYPDLDSGLVILHRTGLIHSWKRSFHQIDESRMLPYVNFVGSSFGVQLFAAAHNKLHEWRQFCLIDFASWDPVKVLRYKAFSLDELIGQI